MYEITIRSWESNWDEWVKKYIYPATRSKEYDLLVDEIGPEIYSFPLFTADFCRDMVAEVESRGEEQWTKQRHEFYPTTDVPLADLGLNEMYHKVLVEFAHPFPRKNWRLEGDKWLNDITEENFLVRYRAQDQQHLSVHHDYSEYTFTVGLSNDFEGGGTWFPRQKILANPRSGYCSLFPGVTHPHGGRPTIAGIRYIIVSFCRRKNLYISL